MAGSAAVGAVLLAAAWKVRMWMRGDVRDDSAAQAAHVAELQMHAGIREMFSQFREEIQRLAQVVDEQHGEIMRERAARREAEERAILCEARYAVLENEVKNLKQRNGELAARVSALEAVTRR